MAGETDGKPRDAATGEPASPVVQDQEAGASAASPEPVVAGRRRGARREPPVIELEATTVAEAEATREPEDPRVAAAEFAPGPGSPEAADPREPGPTEAAAPTPADGAEASPARADAPETAEIRAALGEPYHPPVEEPAPEASAAAPPAAQPEPEPAHPVVTPPPRPSLGLPLGLGLAGGIVGAGIVAVLMTMVGPGADTPDRLTALETAVGDKATRRTAEALEKRAQAVETSVQAVRGELTALAGRPQLTPADLTGLAQRIDRLDRAVAQLAARPAGGDQTAAAAAPVPLPPVVVAGRESAALAVAMLIRDAVARGTPYARELAALEASGADKATVERLRPLAASGAPQAPALAAAFAPLAAALARGPEPAPHAGVVDRVTSLIGGAVRIRPVGEAAGETPAAVGARAETALRRGDLAAALKDLDGLPAPAKATVQPFVDRLKARVAAGQAADALVTTAVEQVIAATASTGVPTR